MAPNPASDADYFRDRARRKLLTLLEDVRGKKNLVISRDLAGPVGLFVKFSVLQEYGVDKVFLLENANVDSSQRNVVFLIHAEKVNQVSATAEQIRRLRQTSNVEHDISIIWVPRRTLVSNKILEESGVAGEVTVGELNLHFLPLEQDVLSLELECAVEDLYLHKDPGPIYLSAKALMDLQQRHGYFPRIVGKGDNARRLADLLVRMRKEIEAEQSNLDHGIGGKMPSSSIENLIIIDRDVDFATPLMTQLTYEGLIEEFVGIRHNQADVDSSIVAPVTQPPAQSSSSAAQSTARQGTKRKIQLDSQDPLFNQLRDANFAIVGDILNRVARRLESDYETRHTAQTTAELREFVNRLPVYQQEHQSLKIHTNLAESIMRRTRSDIFRKVLEVQQNHAAGSDPVYQHDNVHELIARDVPLKTILRLLCIESCMSGGIRPKDLENFKREILQAYGYQHLMTFRALEKMELLHPRESTTALLLPGTGAGASAKTNYSYMRRHLRLVVEEVSERDPDDIAYVYSGFAPLSVRLVQCILQKQYIMSITKGSAAASSAASVNAASTSSPGWIGFEDIVKNARGATFSIVQKGDEKATRARQTLLSGASGMKTVYVFFLGGITFTEISALRFIARHEAEANQRRIVICTTGIVSGDRIMESAMKLGKQSTATP